MKVSNNSRIQEALENAEENIAFLATLSDKKLVEKLDIIHLQSEIAIQKKQTTSIGLLEVWRTQVIEARIYKAENNIPDAPNKIEIAIADVETVVAKSEERIEILEEMLPKSKKRKLIENDDDQLSLF
ncbi:MAG: hypothetical protein ABIQ40_12610 [Bacteroidia bacterium]